MIRTKAITYSVHNLFIKEMGHYNDSVITEFFYDDNSCLIKKTVMPYSPQYKRAYEVNPLWGLFETTYTYYDQKIINEKTVKYVGDGSKIEPIITKEFNYNGSTITSIATRFSFPKSNPYKTKIITETFSDDTFSQLISYSEETSNGIGVNEYKITYDELGRKIQKEETSGITKDNLTSIYRYY